MKTWRAMMAVVLVALVCAGCIQDQKIFKLKRDGSGTLTEEIYMSPQLTGMMEQMTAGMAQAMDQGGSKPKSAAPAKALDPLAMFKDDIVKRTAALGPGVKLVSSKAKTNDKGWKGYEVVFSFADITKLKFNLSQDDVGEGEPGAPKKKADPLLVEFRKSPQPMVIFKELAKAKAAPAPKQTESAPGMEGMAAMMGPMLQGMRISCIVEVDGKITRTTSHHQQGDNKVVLMDLLMDKVLANAEGMKLIGGSKEDPDALNKLRALNIPGLALEDMTRGITIEWR
jgi:outer membrane murein-binding lipoprotein Lpp